ncbi:MAG: hypothetical protein IT546_16725 [Caulobacteraceae bacterium]|nr:hypothetical protein [Caulobacteraceae bacterium]
MASFSATDAAFEGFRLTREQPRTLFIWAGFNLVVSVLSLILMESFGDSYLQSMTALEQAGANADPEQTLQLVQNLTVASLPWLALSLIIQAMLGAAVYRAVLRPAEKGVGYLKLGGDEARLVGLSLIYLVLFVVGLSAVVIVASLVVTLAGRAVGGSVAALVGAGVGLFVSGLIIYVIVRLSLAGVVTFARRRISVFGSWPLTRGQFWSMTGAYVLTLASVIVVMLLSVIIFMVIAAILTGGNLAAVGAMFTPGSSLTAYLSPAMIAYIVFAALLNAVYYAAIFAPHAVIYRALTGDGQAEVFS